jgi:hypothetical protein
VELRAHSNEPVLLCDWDTVSLGPREIDLVPIHHERRSAAPSHVVDAFASTYGYDVTTWTGYSVLLEIRELSTLTALIKLAAFESSKTAELKYRSDH